MKVLVTGASGYLGLNLVKRLIKDEFEVYALTRKPLDFTHVRLHVITADLFDINAKLQGVNIDAVFHTAARINFDESQDSLSQLTRDNIMGTYQLADFIINNGVRKVIHSSSCSVYEEKYNKEEWTSEDSKLRPRNTYAVSKLSSEWILENMLKNSTKELIILRYSSIYGCGQRGGSIVPALIANATKNIDLSLFGSGNRIQDYVYIDDVVESNLKCLNTELEFNTILNIGSGEQVTDLMLAEQIITHWNSNSEIKVLNTSKDPDTYFSYDIKKAADLIGYTPLKLAEGLTLYRKSQELE